MSTRNKKKKKQSYPIIQAHRISFKEQTPEAYYTKDEKKQLAAHQKQSNIYGTSSEPASSIDVPQSVYNPIKTMGPNIVEDDATSDDGDDDDENESTSKQQTHKLKKSKNNEKEKETESTDDNKGLLKKAVTIVKEAVQSKEEKKEIIRTRVVIELPRDILTAFFLIRLPRDASRGVSKSSEEYGTTHWADYNFVGKTFLWISVLMPYMVQWFVLAILLTELADKWEDVQQVDSSIDFWYNTVAFTVLFLYMWKDVAAFYFSVWRYIEWLQKRKGGIMKNLKEAVVDATEVAKAVVAAGNDETEDTQLVAEDVADEMKVAFQFIEFRIWLLSVVFLYLGLTLYSLLSIPLEEGLLGKMEVSLSVFFVLEVDDWAYQLFFAQANILDDEEFDVKIILEKDRNAFQKQKQKQLATTVVLVVSSILACWAAGWGINELNLSGS